jgi:hypothetical protein
MVDWILPVSDMAARVRTSRLARPPQTPEEGPSPAQRGAAAEIEATLREILVYLRANIWARFSYASGRRSCAGWRAA